MSYDPSTDQVDEIDLARAPVDEQTAASLAPIGWTGERVALSASAGASSERLVFYEPGSGRWQIGAVPACAAEEDGYEQAAWVGDRYVVPCGTDRIQVYDVDSDVWRRQWRAALRSTLGSEVRSCGPARTSSPGAEP